MKIIADQILQKIKIIHDDSNLIQSDVNEDLEDAFSRVKDARSIELDELNESEIDQFYNAFVYVKNKPNTLDKISYELNNNRAIQSLILKFNQWDGLALIEKSSVNVLNITDTSSIDRWYLLQTKGTSSQNGLFAKYLTVDPTTLMNADFDKQAAATGFQLNTIVKRK